MTKSGVHTKIALQRDGNGVHAELRGQIYSLFPCKQCSTS